MVMLLSNKRCHSFANRFVIAFCTFQLLVDQIFEGAVEADCSSNCSVEVAMFYSEFRFRHLKMASVIALIKCFVLFKISLASFYAVSLTY